MEIKHQKKLGVTVFYPQGSLTLENADRLKELFKAEVSTGQRKIAVNLQDTSYIDSLGVGILIKCFGDLRTQNGLFAICEPQQYVQSILKLAKLDTFLTIYDTEKECLTAMEQLQEDKSSGEYKNINLKQLDMYIIEIMSFLLKSELHKTYKTKEIIDLLNKIQDEHYKLVHKYEPEE